MTRIKPRPLHYETPETLSYDIIALAREGLTRAEIHARLGRADHPRGRLDALITTLQSRGLIGKGCTQQVRQKQRMARLLRQGLPLGEAAKRIGVGDAEAVRLVEALRRAGKLGPVMPVQMLGALWARLNVAAARRGVTAERLATELLETIARDDLFRAVIDEEAAE